MTDDPLDSLEALETRLSFLERHLEKLDVVFAGVHDQLRTLERAVERLEQQAKKRGPGGTESPEDAVPPHYSNRD